MIAGEREGEKRERTAHCGLRVYHAWQLEIEMIS